MTTTLFSCTVSDGWLQGLAVAASASAACELHALDGSQGLLEAQVGPGCVADAGMEGWDAGSRRCSSLARISNHAVMTVLGAWCSTVGMQKALAWAEGLEARKGRQDSAPTGGAGTRTTCVRE